MAIPKYTDPAVQNKTPGKTTDHEDEHQQKTDQPGMSKNISEDKRKGYKEGNKDDSITQEDADDKGGMKDSKSSRYGKRL